MKKTWISRVDCWTLISGGVFAQAKLIGRRGQDRHSYRYVGTLFRCRRRRRGDRRENGDRRCRWKNPGKPIELISADHQNKADIAANKAREWFDTQKVDMIAELLNSAVGLAVQEVGKQKKRITMNSGAAASRLTGADCSPYGVHWTYDTYALSNGTGKAMVKQGGDTWFFLTADYAFGKNLEKDTTTVVKANGGKVLGSVLHPLSSSDFSGYLLQAQASKAKVIGLANAGGDTINSVKQANEFGITRAAKTRGLAGVRYRYRQYRPADRAGNVS